MTNEVEKQFFDTFGIEPKKGCTAYDKLTEKEPVNKYKQLAREKQKCEELRRSIYKGEYNEKIR